MGTDPEIFVLLEAYSETTEAEPTWRLCPVRFTGSGISLKQAETTIWGRQPWENYERDKYYDFLYGVEHLKAKLPEEASEDQ